MIAEEIKEEKADIAKLLEETRDLARETRDLAAKTHNYIKWVRVMDFIKVLLIVLPIIAAWLYLPSLINLFSAGYGDLLPSGLLK